MADAIALKAAARVRQPDGARPTRHREPAASRSDLPTLFAFAKSLLTDTFARKQITTDHYEIAYRKRIHDQLGRYRLDEITPRLVRDWCDQLVRELGDRDIAKRAAKTLIWMLNEAVAEGHLVHNPANGLKFERRARAAVAAGAPSAADHVQKKPTLNRPQYEQLKRHAATVGLRELVMVRLLVEGTLRRNELLGLRWCRFDRDGRTLAVVEGVTYAPGAGTVVGEPKTKKSNRLVVLSNDLCEILDAYRATRPHLTDDVHYVIPGHVRHTNQVDAARPLNPDACTRQLVTLIASAKLLNDEGSHLTDVQGLRATGSSIADAAGVPRSIVEAQLGHAGQTTYERHYRDVSTAPERFQFADAFEPARHEPLRNQAIGPRSHGDQA